uniref:CCHC-type domain-containing protein n=1 Tax=Peronospora matthiolae TaxID=2874970 RepID=A0AAV1UTV3_9STRA
MDAAATPTARINKFQGTNFHTWKFKMQMVLEERDRWEVTCGEVKLVLCTNVMDQSKFKRKSRKALAIICLAMKDSQLPLVRSSIGAYDAWSSLEGHYETKILANRLFLRRHFFTTMMVKVMILSESYQILITALESRSDSLSWEIVTSRLMHEDMKRKEQGGGVDGSAHGQGQAFMTINHSKRKGGRPVQKASACHYCGEQGHWIAKCPVRIRENAERQRSQRASVAQVEEDSGDFLFSVDGDNIKLIEEWLVDSGATQHIAYSKECIKNYQKISPVDVHLADDGVVQAVGKGDIIMSMRTKHGVKKGVLTGVWHLPKLRATCSLRGVLRRTLSPSHLTVTGALLSRRV